MCHPGCDTNKKASSPPNLAKKTNTDITNTSSTPQLQLHCDVLFAGLKGHKKQLAKWHVQPLYNHGHKAVTGE